MGFFQTKHGRPEPQRFFIFNLILIIFNLINVTITILKCVLWTWVNENTVTGKDTHTQSVFVPSLPPPWCSLSGPLQTWAAPHRSENRNSPPASSPTRTETTSWFHEGNLWQKTHIVCMTVQILRSALYGSAFYYLKNKFSKNISFEMHYIAITFKDNNDFLFFNLIMTAYTLQSQTFLFWRLLQNNNLFNDYYSLIYWQRNRRIRTQFGDAI